ncbi:MAG: FAD-dependent oxidoreductase [Nitrososphaerota archaeon]|nr:FAD-dependent oxidoreductase [Nitrososphaerota archaeon]
MTKSRIVILGCGFAGLRAFYRLSRGLHNSVDFLLVDERKTSLEKPSLPEVALAGKPLGHVQIPLEPLLKERGGTFLNAAVDRIDADGNLVKLSSGETVTYDYLVLALGATKGYDRLPGFREHGYSVCDDFEAPRLWNALNTFPGGPIVVGAAKTEWGSRVKVPALAAPCEGPVGEVMFMVDYFLREKGLRDRSTITVFSPGETFFEDVGPSVHGQLGPTIERRGIKVMTGKTISRIEEDSVHFEDGAALESKLTIVIPEYLGNPVVARSELGDEKGFVPTDSTMRHLSHQNIFAAGDATSLSMPKLGHIAIMQADIAAASLVRDLTGEGEIPAFQPEIFCVMNRGGTEATLILSDYLFGGKTDLALDGPAAHLMKWGFDSYYFYTKGHMPPDALQHGIEGVLGVFKKGFVRQKANGATDG